VNENKRSSKNKVWIRIRKKRRRRIRRKIKLRVMRVVVWRSSRRRRRRWHRYRKSQRRWWSGEEDPCWERKPFSRATISPVATTSACILTSMALQITVKYDHRIIVSFRFFSILIMLLLLLMLLTDSLSGWVVTRARCCHPNHRWNSKRSQAHWCSSWGQESASSLD